MGAGGEATVIALVNAARARPNGPEVVTTVCALDALVAVGGGATWAVVVVVPRDAVQLASEMTAAAATSAP